jgi:hypothetical protein
MSPTLPTSPATSPASEARAFTEATLLGLHALEAREGRPRRFGAEADARWARFSDGRLGLAARLNLLLRDAAVAWPAAFAPARVFALPGLADDEPFGPWSLPALGGRQLEAAFAPSATPPTFAGACAAWGASLRPVALPPLGPARRLLLDGPSAIAAALAAFAVDGELDWARQVTLIAATPLARHLAGLSSVFAGAASAAPLIAQAPAGAEVIG